MKVLYLIWFALAAIVHGTIDNLDTHFGYQYPHSWYYLSYLP